MREQNEAIKESVEIDLQKLLLAYLHKWWVVVICAIVAALGTLFVTANFVTPTYRASVTVYVNNTRADQVIEYLSNSNLEASKQLVGTYTYIIGSDSVLSKVVEKTELAYSISDIRAMMTTQQVDDTVIFRIHITHPDRYVAAKVANAIASVAPTEIEEFVEGSSAKIVDFAKIPTSRYTPNYKKNTMLGATIGVVVALLYITLRYLLDVRIKDSEDLAMLFEVPILGQIPSFTATESKKKGYGYEPKSEHVSENTKDKEEAAPVQEAQKSEEKQPDLEKPKKPKKNKSARKEEKR